MSELRVETWTLPAATLGPENPLPVLAAGQDVHAALKLDPSVPVEDREHLGWGAPRGLLPYRLLDGYDRTRVPRPFPVVVLENEILRAAFFVGVGGRLWSLVHKPTGRELLAANPVFQPCNLALRNAWLSGGVEWNIGWTGHWPYTGSPLFAARVARPDGTPGLRLWEWERVRQTPFQIDAWLPPGSPVLLVRVAVHNPLPETIPMYWWSNIAVEQREGVRVLVPAADALTHSYGGGLTCVPLPVFRDRDNSYVTDQPHSSDMFYRIPAAERPWIAVVDRTGRGLCQTSTARLRGRKLFRWGTHGGGQRWQRFLGTPDYIEIQAGLARTQSHHLPMPAGATWTWLEAYGDLAIDPDAAHGRDWARARQAAAAGIESLIPAARLEAELEASAPWAATPAADLVSQGSGWGALEAARRERAGAPRMELPGISFPAASLGAEQQSWLALLETGRFPERAPLDDPGSFQVQREWMDLLERSLSAPGGRHWAALFHYGVMQWHWGRRVGAAEAWQASLRLQENPWAERCLGMAALIEQRPADALPHLARARALRPTLVPLAIEWLRAGIECGQYRQVLDEIRGLPPEVRAHGRVRLLEGRARLAVGDLEALEGLLAEAPVVCDMREGETSLSDLWFGLHEQREARRSGAAVDDALRARVRREHPVPAGLDFRMRE